MDKTRPPFEAFRFYALPESASVDPAADAGPRKFRGVPYSGDVVTGSPFWDAVIFDLATTQAPPKVPVLVEHDRAQRAGFASLTIGPDRIDVADGTFLDNAHGRAVAADSDAGFPWQMSVHIEPGKIDTLSPGERASVNGREVVGPASIFRNSLIREISWTPTGADPGTSALAASLGFASASTPKQKGDPMTLEELQSQNTQFAARVTTLESETTQFRAERDAALARVTAAEQALRDRDTADRAREVETLFSVVGIPHTPEAAAPYLGMDATTFSAVATQLKALKVAPPDTLFSAQATSGASPNDDAAVIARLAAL